MSSTDLETARREAAAEWPSEDSPGDEAARRGRSSETSISERAENGGERGEGTEQVEIFPLGSVDGDPKVTIDRIIPPGVDVQVTASMRAAEVPSRSGMLLDPSTEGKVQVSYRVEKVELVLHRDDGGYIDRAKIRQVLRPIYVEEVSSEE